MKKTKENSIYNLNTILLSALGNESSLFEELIEENESISQYVDKDLKKTFKSVIKGAPFIHDKEEDANETNVVAYMFNNQYAQAYWTLTRLLKNEPDNIEYIKSIVISLINMKAYKTAIKYFISKLLPFVKSDAHILEIVAGAYFGDSDHYEDAIPLYEEYIKHYPENYGYHFRLAFLYERVYQDQKLDKQIEYAKKALNTNENINLVYTMLAKFYYRKGDKKTCKVYLDKMMANNPSPQDYVTYSRYLTKEGKITEGYGLYRCRFDTKNVTYPDKLLPEKRWDGKADISNSTVIVHYEQGFGDSVMFCRYIPEIAKKAKKVIFVVQKNLIPILKSSGFDRYCEILSHEADLMGGVSLEEHNKSVMFSGGSGMERIPHDYHIPLMDTPYLVGESPDRMTEAGGYLYVDKDKVNEFRKQYINKNKKIKIGLSYHGSKASIVTYRDISVKKFLPLLKMEGVEFYSFQSDQYAEELQELDKTIKITDLGKVFNNFEDTACAMNCMDLIISTDNVVMNLAGALGVKAYGLFNVITESRWYKTEGDDIGWYKSVKPFRAKTFNDWDNLMLEVKDQIIKDFNL